MKEIESTLSNYNSKKCDTNKFAYSRCRIICGIIVKNYRERLSYDGYRFRYLYRDTNEK
jgi:hypothetical protein